LSKSSSKDRTLALAGVFQAARLVQQLARQGRSDKLALAASLGSVLAIDCASTEDVYGGAGGVILGLQLVRDKLSGRADSSDIELTRYVLGVLQLQRKIGRNKPMLDAIREGIAALSAQLPSSIQGLRADESLHASVACRLAELYSLTLSTLTPRIMVSGAHGYLANPAIADKVRAALFAGIRSAFLWRQLGGNRWQLLFTKRAIVRESMSILAQLRAPDAIA
jgi:high frequency lysogenization protein